MAGDEQDSNLDNQEQEPSTGNDSGDPGSEDPVKGSDEGSEETGDPSSKKNGKPGPKPGSKKSPKAVTKVEAVQEVPVSEEPKSQPGYRCKQPFNAFGRLYAEGERLEGYENWPEGTLERRVANGFIAFVEK